MNKHTLVGVGLLLGLCLLTISGCSFFGGDDTPYTYWEPALSPDGTLLAYESDTDASLELFVLDLNSNVERQVTINDQPDWSPSWSPDGTQLAFVSVYDKNVDISTLNLETLEVVRITTDSGDDINPDWGSDGLIYFNSNRSDTWEIYAIDPNTLALRKITSVGATP
jgi:Tol biopolymer transport system component